MDTIPKVSVILPVYNGEKTVAEAVRSILNQHHENFELLIVDDCSIDRTSAIVDSLQDPRVRIFHLPENVGRAEARNFGMSAARGVYLAMMDADDISYPDRLRLQVSFMDTHPELALCGGWADLLDPTGRRLEWRQPHDPALIKRNLLRSNPFIHSTILFRRGVIDDVGGFDKTLEPAEDYDLYLRIAAKYPVAVLPYRLAEYRATVGLHYRVREQWAKLPVRWKAIFSYGYPRTELWCLATPLIGLLLPVRVKLYLRGKVSGLFV